MDLDYTVLLPVLVSFGLSLVLCPIGIPFLKRLKFGQFVRDDGPQSHIKKAGTPTMGGLIILLAFTIATLIFYRGNEKLLPIMFVTLGFGLIGFLDDFIKVVMKRSMGLHAWQKMLGQIVVTGVFAYYMVTRSGLSTELLIPFSDSVIDVGGWYVPLLFFVVLGTVNGANFTDGLDGLASSVTIMIVTFFTVVAIGMQAGISTATCAGVGSLLGFLVYNVYPAKVFMGDTGSLALGGLVASTAYMLKMPLFIPIVAFIYLLEVASVIIQVASYKTTKKRVFKMAPIHHHFELSGWPETKVVAIFSIVTAVLCIVALMGL